MNCSTLWERAASCLKAHPSYSSIVIARSCQKCDAFPQSSVHAIFLALPLSQEFGQFAVQGSCCGCAHGKQDRIAGSSCRASSWACIIFQIKNFMCYAPGKAVQIIRGLVAKTAFKCFGQTWGKALRWHILLDHGLDAMLASSVHDDDTQLTKPKLQSVDENHKTNRIIRQILQMK